MFEGYIKLCSTFFTEIGGGCENEAKDTRGNFVRKTVSARGDSDHQAPHTENVFTNLYVSPTKLKFIPYTTYIDRNGGLSTAKYCSIRVLNLCGEKNEYANYP
jgi:hypothetical protein